jgi:hypothetical protein
MNLILEKQTKVSPKKKVSKNYFTQETEDAIVLYNNTPDPVSSGVVYMKKKYTMRFLNLHKILFTHLNFIILR